MGGSEQKCANQAYEDPILQRGVVGHGGRAVMQPVRRQQHPHHAEINRSNGDEAAQ